MDTEVTGFPCIGRKRELKFLIERYLAGTADLAALEDGAAALRREVWQELSIHGIDGIPSNDFTLYDAMLDTALLFNVVPASFKEAGLSGTDLLFALARGLQRDDIDLPALPLRKWFDTNYHYIVPRFETKTHVRLAGTKALDEYREARALCIETRPRLIGPYSFLTLSSFEEGVSRESIAPALLDAWLALLDAFAREGVREIQIDEPALVLDMDDTDIALFRSLWGALSKRPARPAFLLQTMYGDVRDVWETLGELCIDAIGLDFVAGEKTLELVLSSPWPAGRRLVAGLVDARSVWKDDEEGILQTLAVLVERGIPTSLGTSASLAHLPWTLEGEEALPPELRASLAFAREKIALLARLARTVTNTAPRPQGAHVGARGKDKAEEAISFDPSLMERTPSRELRRKIQQKHLGLPLLPTTTIGSFPQDSAVHALRRRLTEGTIDRETCERDIRRMIGACIDAQERIGLDVLVHGEFERTDMVEFFGRELEGFAFTRAGWVRSYGTRCVKPPIITGPVCRRGPVTVELARYAQSLSEKPVKGMLTGPVTILNWSFPARDRSRAQQALEIARAIREEVLDLEAAGIAIIQIDEAALKEKLPLRRADWQKGYLDWAIPCFRLCHSGVRPETQIHTHMCYSDFTQIVAAIEAMDADVISFEAARSELSILEAIEYAGFQTATGPGLWDIHSPRVPSVEEMEAKLIAILRSIPADRVWVNPDCGLKTRAWRESLSSLEHLVEAARRVRKRLQAADSADATHSHEYC